MARQKLKVVDSALLMNKKFNMCGDCISRNIEPRWAIILAGRAFGVDHVLDVINERRYTGDEISVRDLFS